jgi:hypothetical protein
MDHTFTEKSVGAFLEKQVALRWLDEAAAARLFVWVRSCQGYTPSELLRLVDTTKATPGAASMADACDIYRSVRVLRSDAMLPFDKSMRSTAIRLSLSKTPLTCACPKGQVCLPKEVCGAPRKKPVRKGKFSTG